MKVKVEVDGKEVPYIEIELLVSYAIHYEHDCPWQTIKILRYLYEAPGKKVLPPHTVQETYRIADIRTNGKEIIITTMKL